MALELYTTGNATLVQPVVAQLWQNGTQVGSDLPATATSATHFVASIPVVGIPPNLTDGYQVIWVDSATVPRQISCDQVLWDGVNEVFRGSIASTDQANGNFI